MIRSPYRSKPLLGASIDPSHPLASGLVSFFVANEQAGTTLHDAATPWRVGTMASAASWTPGAYGPALNFDGSGSGDYVGFSDVGLPTGGADITIAARVRTSATHNGFYFQYGDTAGSFHQIYIGQYNLGSGLFFILGFGGVNLNPPIPLNDGTWKDLVVTISSTGYSLFGNGVPLVGGGIGGTKNTAPVGTAYISSNDNQDWQGQVDYLAIWSRQISGDEAALLAGNPWGLFHPPVARAIRRSVAYTLTTAPGSFAFTGKAAGTYRGSKVIATPAGSFTFTGKAASLTKTSANSLSAAPGTFALTGQAAGLRHASKLPTAAGTFTETGLAAGTYRGSKVIVAAGSFTETGLAAGLRYGSRVIAMAGAFAFTGKTASLVKTAGTTLIATAGNFAVTGQAAALRHAAKLTTAAGTFALTGKPAGLSKTAASTIIAAPGAFVLTGRAATLTTTASPVSMPGHFVFTGMATGDTAVEQQTFRQALHAQLVATDVLTTLIGTAIYPNALPSNHDLQNDGPALVYSVEPFGRGFGHPSGHTLSGTDGTKLARVLLSAMSYRYADADAITEVLRESLDGLNNTAWGNGSVPIMSCLQVNEADSPQAATTGRPWVLFEIDSFFDVRYRIPFPSFMD